MRSWLEGTLFIMRHFTVIAAPQKIAKNASTA
jgi:hypothetical protein